MLVAWMQRVSRLLDQVLTELIPLQGISAAGQAIGEHTSLCLVTIREVCFAGFFLFFL